jgi:hypothetical protein
MSHTERFVSARIIAQATARPVCEALELAMARHGVPEQILTDKAKVFTARFGTGPDRCCSIGSITTTLPAIS